MTPVLTALCWFAAGQAERIRELEMENTVLRAEVAGVRLALRVLKESA